MIAFFFLQYWIWGVFLWLVGVTGDWATWVSGVDWRTTKEVTTGMANAWLNDLPAIRFFCDSFDQYLSSELTFSDFYLLRKRFARLFFSIFDVSGSTLFLVPDKRFGGKSGVTFWGFLGMSGRDKRRRNANANCICKNRYSKQMKLRSSKQTLSKQASKVVVIGFLVVYAK